MSTQTAQTGGNSYSLWERLEDGNWSQKKISILSSQELQDIITHAEQFVGPLPTQLMQVLPSGHKRIALWIDGERVSITDLP